MASVPNMRPAPVLATPGAAPAPDGAAAIDFTTILSQVPGEAILSGPGLPGGQPTIDLAPAEGAPADGETRLAGKEEATGEEAVDENATIVIAQQIADLVPIVLAQGIQPVAVTIPVPAGSIATVPTGAASGEPAVATATATATTTVAVALARATLPGPVAATNLPAQAPAAALQPAASDPAAPVQGGEAARPDPRTAAPIATTPTPVATPQKAHVKGEPAAAPKSPGAPSPSLTIVPPAPPGVGAAATDAPMPAPVAKPPVDVATTGAGTEAVQVEVAKSPAPKRSIEALRASPERVADAPPPATVQAAAIGAIVESEGKRPAPARAAAIRATVEVQAQPQVFASEAAATVSAPQTPFAAIQPATSLAAAPLSAPGQAAAAAPGQELGIERELDLAHEGEWLDRLARDIVRAGANDGAMRFRLNPQTLGHLQVELAQGDHGTSIRLSVETEAARAILVDAQPRLLAEARAQGVRIAESEVDLAGSGHQPGSDPRRQAEGPQTPFIRTARGGGSAAAEAAADPAPPRSDRYA